LGDAETVAVAITHAAVARRRDAGEDMCDLAGAGWKQLGTCQTWKVATPT
jgi:hypothetical protein